MFIAYLARNAGRVVMPEAVDVMSSVSEDLIDFIDNQGRVLVRFSRPDLAIYSKDSDPIGDLLAIESLLERDEAFRRP